MGSINAAAWANCSDMSEVFERTTTPGNSTTRPEIRRALVAHAPGFEHPGDPSQPDNTHRH
ncbi:hypothetical protein GCM10009839_59950 [Catenulispora yoronensis]|uniref:Uncharacterized protein n=1 Tax=Catenulispora yoronensis TaxID=450799 RepID=A0ABN2V354_9ACTN